MPRNLDTDLLRAFIAVADTGGFTRAAGVLNCTQSAVSMQIKRLEGIIRSELVIRSNKGLRLTTIGEGVLDYARRIVLLNDQIVETVLDRRTNGVVRIGLMEDYATAVIPPLVKRFLAAYPNIYVEVHTGLSAHMRNQIGKQYDLVLAMEAAGGGSGELLRTERPVWARAPTMPADHDTVPVALYPRDCVFRDLMIESLEAAGRAWRIAYHSPSISAVQAAVKEGIALGVFKASTLPAPLRRLSPSDGFGEMPCVDIVLHRALRLKRSNPASLFADFLVGAMNPTAAVGSMPRHGHDGVFLFSPQEPGKGERPIP
ncbi:LysR substrate-binding domain-containing protein [Reyranella sp. CPCC 100927]|uniref:LysR substrate-binding domain-containing protein n=1 Tax=Reyranella sp. CPCC 100927 TaxID=2599616 RepID=UPI0021026017|nr:LysR substrate-binding domain-containing protein [Reyranella sp. CPCC 100927]